MPDPTDKQTRDIPIYDAITQPHKAALPKLAEFVSVTRPDTEGETPLPAPAKVTEIPTLPPPEKVEKFYVQSLPHLKLPSNEPSQKETLSLDDMLSLITPTKSEHAAPILQLALKYFRLIDGRAFKEPASPYQRTPFKELEAHAQAASELLKRTKVVLSVVKAHFSADPQQILKTFTEAVAHYRGELKVRPLHDACRMAAYEMVQDTGVTPHIPRAEMSSQATIPTEQPKQRKVLNYGRPDSDSNPSDSPRGDNRSDAEIRREQLQASRLEGETFQRKEEQQAFDDLRNEIRKPKRPNERYGKFTLPAATTNSSRRLDALPDSIKFAIEVSAAENLTSSHTTPPIQGVALEIADWAKDLISYAESHRMQMPQSGESNATLDIAELQKRLFSVIKYHIHCKHIVQVVEDLSQQIRELGGYDSLSDDDKTIVDCLAPLRTADASTQTAASEGSSTTSPMIQNSWGGEPISGTHASEANAARIRAEKIRLLALKYLAQPTGRLRFIEDPETQLKVATEMATEAVDKPKRLPGQ